MLPRSRRLAGPLALAGALGALFCAGSARAQVTVTSTVTSVGSLFTYKYSIVNFMATDVLVVNLNNLPRVTGALTNLTAPAGFQISAYDPGVGIESFLADSLTFAPGSTISGFSFTSLYGPVAVPFDTVNIDGSTTTGMTRAPGAAPVPEASTLISLGAGVLMLTLVAVRRRRTACAGVRS